MYLCIINKKKHCNDTFLINGRAESDGLTVANAFNKFYVNNNNNNNDCIYIALIQSSKRFT